MSSGLCNPGINHLLKLDFLVLGDGLIHEHRDSEIETFVLSKVLRMQILQLPDVPSNSPVPLLMIRFRPTSRISRVQL
jgi:hypothetical protein